MANEIQISAGITVNKGGAQISRSASKALTMAGGDMVCGTQSIGFAAAEQLTFGEITGAPAAMWIKNLDAANFVVLSLNADGSAPFAKILAGQVNLISPGSATIYAKADTGAVLIELAAAEA